VEPQLKRKTSSKKDYPSMHYSHKEYKREDYSSRTERPPKNEKQ